MAERPSVSVVVGTKKLLGTRGRFKLGETLTEAMVIKVVNVLVRIVVCPSNMILVVTITVLDSTAELPVID